MRHIDNIQILRELEKFLQENPDQRFCQALSNLDIIRRVQRSMGGQTFDHFYVDEAHTESEMTLQRVRNRIKHLKEQK